VLEVANMEHGQSKFYKTEMAGAVSDSLVTGGTICCFLVCA
jgi:hypothetical protein